MKLLTISRARLEMARAHLRKPMLTVGRSPSCDVILRAPGVEPIHFLIEWIGSGTFDPAQGAWAVVDISSSASRPVDAAETGEGVVLSGASVTVGDFVFSAIEDELESTEVIGGAIAQSLAQTGAGASDVLELVQVRVDSGAVEAVSHLPVPERLPRQGRRKRPVPGQREFKIEWVGGRENAVLKLILGEMPGAEVFNRGQRVSIESDAVLKANDVLQVRWKGRDFYLRFVERVVAPPIPHEFWGDPLLRHLALGVGSTGLLLLLFLRFVPVSPPREPVPQRIARVEVLQPPPKLPKVEEPPPVPAEKPSALVQNQSESAKPIPEQANDRPAASKAKPAAATAPRVVTEPAKQAKPGLNSPAKVTDVNAVGLLGALNRSAARGKGVKADKIINEGIVTETTTGLGSSRVVVKNTPAGVIGSGSGGSISAGKGLGEASTTLKGAGKYDPSSVGPIARKGGATGFNVGTGLKDGKGAGGELGSVDGGDFSVEGGGLDRETVRRVIQSRRGEVRTCYERALLTQSNLEGRVVYNWRISADGSVISVEITKSNLDAPGLRACVLEVIRKIGFPKAANGKATRVIYPFVFQGKR